MISVKVKHFEEGPSWTEKRSLSSTSASAASNGGKGTVSVCTMDLSSSSSPTVDMDSFNEVLTASSPSFVFIHNVSRAGRLQMMESPLVRRSYGVTDFVRYEPRDGADRGTVALVRAGAGCDGAEAGVRPVDGGAARLFLSLQVRLVAGVTLAAAALLIDPAASPAARVATFASAVPLLGSAEILVLCSNLAETGRSGASDVVLRELVTARTARGFTDAAEEAPAERTAAAPAAQTWLVWVKSAKFAATHMSCEVPAKGLPPVTFATIGPRGAQPIAIPQPRSAKTGTTKGSPATSPAMITDPAILSAEAAAAVGSGKAPAAKPATNIMERLLQRQQQQRWRVAQSVALKANDKLNNNEVAFDITAFFESVKDVLDALNGKVINGKVTHWPADFCVAHSMLLVSDAVGSGDRRAMFRRYARDYKNSASLITQMFTAVSSNVTNNTGNVHHKENTVNSTNSPAAAAAAAAATAPTATSAGGTGAGGVGAEKTWSKKAPVQSGNSQMDTNGCGSEENVSLIPVSRAMRRDDEQHNRSWDISCCTVVYQVTPREMKFNITKRVGLEKNNLKVAIECLNRGSQSKNVNVHSKENPLSNYPHDYALLFSVELQGFWLIAATHVPCDIVACRAAA